MDYDFRRNYQNKIKILTRQIHTLINSATEGHSFKEKFSHLSAEQQEHVAELMALRKQIKHQLRHGPYITHYSVFQSSFVFFRPEINPSTRAQTILIERLKRDKSKTHKKENSIFTPLKKKSDKH